MDGANYLVAIGNAMACGEYDAISECFFEYGLGSKMAITLPYGFTLEVEPIDSVSEIAWDNYSMGIISSLMTDCGSVVLSLGRIEVDAFKLLRAICIFSTDFGIKMFIGADKFLYTDAGQSILKILKCDDAGDLINMALEALNMILSNQCGIPIEAHTFEELGVVYQQLCSVGFVKQMATKRNYNNRWTYPCNTMQEMIHFWCSNYNRTFLCVSNGSSSPIKLERLNKALANMPEALKSAIMNNYIIDGYIYNKNGEIVR